MTGRMISRLVVPVLALGVAAVAVASEGARPTSGSGVASLLAAPGAVRDVAAPGQKKGRYKKDGKSCHWDANDTGPDQCAPVTTGRFKKNGDACVWDGADSGADQCKPDKGRFKKEGTACVWNATDSGPDQCDPRQAK